MQTSQSQARRLYAGHKSGAKRRGIGFELTFEQWMGIWGDKLSQRGRRMDQLGMCRINDEGPYAVGNVYLGTPARNGASRRMALENRKGKDSRYVFVPSGKRDPIDPLEEDTDEAYLGRVLGMKTSSVWS